MEYVKVDVIISIGDRNYGFIVRKAHESDSMAPWKVRKIE